MNRTIVKAGLAAAAVAAVLGFAAPAASAAAPGAPAPAAPGAPAPAAVEKAGTVNRWAWGADSCLYWVDDATGIVFGPYDCIV